MFSVHPPSEYKASIILQHTAHMLQKRGKILNSNMLSHLNTCNLVIFESIVMLWYVPIVINDPITSLINTLLSCCILGKCHLLFCQCTSGTICTAFSSPNHQSTPSTTNIQVIFTLFQVNRVKNRINLSLLRNLQTLLFISRLVKYPARINHGRSQEPAIEVVTAVINISNFACISLLCVTSQLSQEGE